MFLYHLRSAVVSGTSQMEMGGAFVAFDGGV